MGRLWHYVQNGMAQGPASEEQIRGLLAAGTLRVSDLAWSEGMADWKAIQSIPELALGPAPMPALAPIPAPVPAPMPVAPVVMNPYVAPQTPLEPFGARPGAGGSVSEESIEHLRKTKPWVRLLAILGMIGMALMVLGGLAMAVMGGGFFRYMGMAARLGMALVYVVLAFLYLPPVLFLNRYASRIADLVEDRSITSLEEALRAQKSFWKYVGVFTVIIMCLYALVLVGMLVTGLAMGRMF